MFLNFLLLNLRYCSQCSAHQQLTAQYQQQLYCYYRGYSKYGYTYWFFFKMLLETGMRKGEVAALTWNDIDL